MKLKRKNIYFLSFVFVIIIGLITIVSLGNTFTGQTFSKWKEEQRDYTERPIPTGSGIDFNQLITNYFSSVQRCTLARPCLGSQECINGVCDFTCERDIDCLNIDRNYVCDTSNSVGVCVKGEDKPLSTCDNNGCQYYSLLSAGDRILVNINGKIENLALVGHTVFSDGLTQLLEISLDGSTKEIDIGLDRDYVFGNYLVSVDYLPVSGNTYFGVCIKGLCGGYQAVCSDSSNCLSGVCDDGVGQCTLPFAPETCLDYSASYPIGPVASNYIEIDDLGIAYFGGDNGKFYAVDLSKTATSFTIDERSSYPVLKWVQELGSPVSTFSVLDYVNDRIYVGTEDNGLFAFSLVDGSLFGNAKSFLLPTEDEPKYFGIPYIYQDKLFVLDSLSRVFVFDISNGNFEYYGSFTIGKDSVQSSFMSFDPNLGVGFIGNSLGEMYLVNFNTFFSGNGVEISPFYTKSGESFLSQPYITDDSIYYASCKNIYKFNRLTEDLEIEESLESSVQSKCVYSALNVIGDKLLVAADDGKMYAYHKDTFQLEWTFDPIGDAAIRSMPQVGPNDVGIIYVGNEDGVVYAVNIENGLQVGDYYNVEGPVRRLNFFTFLDMFDKIIFGTGEGLGVLDLDRCVTTMCVTNNDCRSESKSCIGGACQYPQSGDGESCVYNVMVGEIMDLSLIPDSTSVDVGVQGGYYLTSNNYCQSGLVCDDVTYRCISEPAGAECPVTENGVYDGINCASGECASQDILSVDGNVVIEQGSCLSVLGDLCVLDEQCARDLNCVNGVCSDLCDSNDDCFSGVCDFLQQYGGTSGVCTIVQEGLCMNDDQCPEGIGCGIDGWCGSFGASCDASDDCLTFYGLVCENNMCVGNLGGTCLFSLQVLPTGQIYTDEDTCVGDVSCYLGMCGQFKADCGSDSDCVSGACDLTHTPEPWCLEVDGGICTDNSFCASGVCDMSTMTCVSSSCVDNSDCLAPLVCGETNICVSACVSDLDCGIGYGCDLVTGVCVSNLCESNDDCIEESKSCIDGSCQYPQSVVGGSCVYDSVTGNLVGTLGTPLVSQNIQDGIYLVSDNYCQSGLVCDSVNLVCIQLLEEGGCNDDNDCDSGYLCEQLMQPIKNIGGLGDDCSSPLETCASLGDVSAKCGDDRICGGFGAECVVYDDSWNPMFRDDMCFSGVCLREEKVDYVGNPFYPGKCLINNGMPCNLDYTCESGLCISGICGGYTGECVSEGLSNYGEECLSDIDCESNLYCSSNLCEYRILDSLCAYNPQLIISEPFSSLTMTSEEDLSEKGFVCVVINDAEVVFDTDPIDLPYNYYRVNFENGNMLKEVSCSADQNIFSPEIYIKNVGVYELYFKSSVALLGDVECEFDVDPTGVISMVFDSIEYELIIDHGKLEEFYDETTDIFTINLPHDLVLDGIYDLECEINDMSLGGGIFSSRELMCENIYCSSGLYCIPSDGGSGDGGSGDGDWNFGSENLPEPEEESLPSYTPPKQEYPSEKDDRPQITPPTVPKEPLEKTKWWTWLLIILGSLIVLGGGGYAVYYYIIRGTNDIETVVGESPIIGTETIGNINEVKNHNMGKLDKKGVQK